MQASATSVLEPAARKGDLAVVADCIKKGAEIDVRNQVPKGNGV